MIITVDINILNYLFTHFCKLLLINFYINIIYVLLIELKCALFNAICTIRVYYINLILLISF